MEKKNLYIDFDGVILDTITPIYQDLEKQQFDSDELLVDFFVNYNWESIVKDENIIGDAINDIEKIIESDKFNLAILTHINSLNEGIIKIQYLRQYFKDITIILCPKKISKTQMVHTKDSILIDDYSGNLEEWEKSEGISIKFTKKKSKNKYKTIKELKEIISMF